MADKDKEIKTVNYIVNLASVYYGRRTNRADRAVRRLKRFVERHLRKDNITKVIITNDVNNYIWSRGREKPPRKIAITVKVFKDEDTEENYAVVFLWRKGFQKRSNIPIAEKAPA
ncbi:MAG: 50S ribosomal protein L31e [Desulfurococcales archaeon]|nr:50S ribosomal protein L31e [Desulfurococcales archaeon]